MNDTTASQPVDENHLIAERRAKLAALRERGGAWAEALAETRPVLCAVNQVMARPGDAVADGDEVAFFPPVTGG